MPRAERPAAAVSSRHIFRLTCRRLGSLSLFCVACCAAVAVWQDAAEAKSGPWLGYWTTARAQIFKRDQVGIKGMDEMKGVMRQCNYKEDPLSHQQCLDGYIQDTSTYHPISTTENCIATRGDRAYSQHTILDLDYA